MRTRKVRIIPALGALAALLLTGGEARADAAGNKALQAYEKMMNSFTDQYGKYKMVIKDRTGDKTVKFTLYNLPGWKRMLKFTYPGDVRGQTFLILSESEMYVYLPAYKRVRRVAGHVRNQGFMGSDFMFDDMAIGSWTHQYTASLIKQDAEYWYIHLRPKPGHNPLWPQLKMKIIKQFKMAVWIEFISRSGRVLRTQSFSNWKCLSKNKNCYPRLVRMVDHRKGNHATDLVTIECKYNVGIPKRKFTLRHLARGG